MDSLNVLAQNMSVKLEQLKQTRAQFPKKHGYFLIGSVQH